MFPHTFQGRLTLGVVLVVTSMLFVASALVLNRLGDYFDQQQRADLEARAITVAHDTRAVTTFTSPDRR